MHTPFNISAALREREARVGTTQFIAIDGHGGSGKSTCAEWLASQLGASIIQSDDFASWDNPFNWVEAITTHVFEPIARGATALSYPRSKWWEHHHPEPVENQPATAVMLLEGVGALRAELRRYISLGIFVDTPESICLERGIARDSGTGTPEAELRDIWHTWMTRENEYFAKDDPQHYADVVLDGTRPFNEQLAC